jgi:hypothetical protein
VAPATRALRALRCGHRGGAPERCADGEAAQMVSGGGVQRRWSSSGGHRRAWGIIAARGRPTGLAGGSRLRNGAARRALTRRGWMAATLGRSPARRMGSGGGKPPRRTPGRWGMSVRRSGVDGRDERRAGEKKSAGGRRLCFKGERWGGGPEGWAPCGGRAGAREGEGGPGTAWSSAAAWRRCGSGSATACAGDGLLRDSGGWQGQRDTGRRG